MPIRLNPNRQKVRNYINYENKRIPKKATFRYRCRSY